MEKLDNYIKNSLEEHQILPSARANKLFEEKLSQRKKPAFIWISSIKWFAAAASIFLFLSIGLNYFNHPKNNEMTTKYAHKNDIIVENKMAKVENIKLQKNKINTFKNVVIVQEKQILEVKKTVKPILEISNSLLSPPNKVILDNQSLAIIENLSENNKTKEHDEKIDVVVYINPIENIEPKMIFEIEDTDIISFEETETPDSFFTTEKKQFIDKINWIKAKLNNN